MAVTHAQACPMAELTPADRDRMWALFATHFDGVDERGFHEDLAQKDLAVLCRHGDRIVGFTSLHILDHPDAPERALCSGDTIMAPEAWGWGTRVFFHRWIHTALACGEPGRRLWWLLICSGFRTWRLMTTFMSDYLPRDGVLDVADTRVRDEFASLAYGDRYDPVSGIVRFARPQVLRPHLAGIPEGRRAMSAEAAFQRLNPGHAAGDELVCLAELGPENLTRAGRRMLAVSEPTAVGAP